MRGRLYVGRFGEANNCHVSYLTCNKLLLRDDFEIKA